ncbi:conserved hypothetical protein [Neisseria meningitidis 053442]|nr:conserved hypothetical protein [Neisseria meningitidis 053442]
MRTGLDSRLRGNDESIHTETCTTSFPRKWESRISGFQSFPIDSRRVGGLDSRLRGNDEFRDCGVVGNDGSIHTETCIPSFPRKWESRIPGFQSFPIDSRRVGGLDSRLRGNDEFRDCGVVGNDGSIHTETCIPSFPRKWESRTRGLSNCFYPISFCADRSGFPPVRE